jgi:hypothetical protein
MQNEYSRAVFPYCLLPSVSVGLELLAQQAGCPFQFQHLVGAFVDPADAHVHQVTPDAVICEHCGNVGEAAPAAVASELKSAARAAGFTPKAPVIEISGICAQCRQAA